MSDVITIDGQFNTENNTVDIGNIRIVTEPNKTAPEARNNERPSFAKPKRK